MLPLLEQHRLRIPYKSNAIRSGRVPEDITLSEWASLHNWCFLCGSTTKGLQVHHIERRPHCCRAHRDWTENLFKACYECHAGPLATMRHKQQLAYKWLNDPSGWESIDDFVRAWLRVRDPQVVAPRRVTADEILDACMPIADEIAARPGIKRILRDLCGIRMDAGNLE